MSSVSPLPLATVTRRGLIGGLILGLAVLWGLLAYALLRYPQAVGKNSPKPNPPAWFGAHGATVFWLLLGALLAALYIWVTIAGTRRDHAAHPWRQGAGVGLLL